MLEALERFRADNHEVFGPPSHKQGRGVDPRVLALLGQDLFRADVLTLNGLDDRSESADILGQAQELMADAVGAEQSFFSTCGSSLSVKSAILAVAGPGEKLLVSRNAHKSVISGVIVSGIVPVWVHPQFDEGLALAHPPAVADVRRALQQHPDAKGVLLISPTDYGTCADIRGIADACHEYDVPLIVDEAWGAVFPFSSRLPEWGMNVGADIVVTSVHKTGAAVEQSSVFHLQGNRVDPYVLKAREDLLGTTSSSSIVYLTLDGWRRWMVEEGSAVLDAAIDRAERLRGAVAGLAGLDVLTKERAVQGGAFDLDPLKICIDVQGLDISGYTAAEWLRAHERVDVGLSDHRRIQAQIGCGDDDHTEVRLLEALEHLVQAAATLERRPDVELPAPGALELPVAMRPRDAFFGRVESVPVAEAPGRIAAELATPYPPGVPAFCPGERLNAEVLDYLRSGLAAGMLLPDPQDPQLNTVRVVAQG
jgi:arginine/lysine/ornithine decarboxylase